MTDEELIDLAEYYRERHNEICQDDFIIEKPDYYNSKGKLIKYKEIKDDWSNVRLTVYNRYCCKYNIQVRSTVFNLQIHRG